MAKYHIQSNLSEKQIELDVSRYLGWISPNGNPPFRLLDVDESLTGADAQFDEVFPLYIQFKKANGLEPISKIPTSNRKNRSKQEEIRIFRHNNGLDDTPTLYFQLRKKAKNAIDYQHNILMQYANTGYSQAFYVAPLTLDKTTYNNSLFNSVNRFLPWPFRMKNIIIHQEKWVSYLGFVPFLREHISIIPHERVNTHNHFYSFSQTGTDIAWHSPELLSKEPQRLSDTLIQIMIKQLYEKKDNLTFNQLAKRLSDTPILSGRENLNIDKPIEIIKEHGKILNEEYNIRQVLLLINRRKINKAHNIV